MERIEQLPAPQHVGQLGHTLTQHDAGSSRFGPCEVCGKLADTTYRQVAWKVIDSPIGLGWSVPSESWGHADCLRGQREAA